MDAKDRMRYRADACKKVKDCARGVQHMIEDDLRHALPSTGNWVNNIVQKGPRSVLFSIMHYKTTKIPPQLQCGAKTSSSPPHWLHDKFVGLPKIQP